MSSPERDSIATDVDDASEHVKELLDRLDEATPEMLGTPRVSLKIDEREHQAE